MDNPVIIQPQLFQLGHPYPVQSLKKMDVVLPEFEGDKGGEVDVLDADEDGAAD